MNKEVTFALTSCNRFNLLEQTIDSFLKYNTYPIKEYILIEDSVDEIMFAKIRNKYGNLFRIIFNKENLGLIKSIDKLYSEVKTPYVFHCEDDWEFFRGGFIEDSLSIIEANKNISYISLRSFYFDVKNYHLDTYIEESKKIGDIRVNKLNNSKTGNIAYSNNPHLFNINQISELLPLANWAISELDIQIRFAQNGFEGVILENPACNHIGWDYSAIDMGRKRLIVKIRNLIKSILNIFGADYQFNS